MGGPVNHLPGYCHTLGERIQMCKQFKRKLQVYMLKQTKLLLTTGLDKELDLERGERKALWLYDLHGSKALCLLFVQTFQCLFV